MKAENNTRLLDIRKENKLNKKNVKLLNIKKIIPLKHLNNICNKFNSSMDYR